MTRRNTAVFGVYAARELSEDGVAHLKSAGFRNTDVALMFPQNEGTKDLAFTKGTKSPEGAVLGAVLGTIIGGCIGWLASVGGIAIPGTFDMATAGPAVSTLAGIAVLGILGGLVGALAGAGRPEYEAKRYDGRVRQGAILISVHCDNAERVEQARRILRETGATYISSAAEAKADFGSDAVKPVTPIKPVDAATPEVRVRTAGGGSGRLVS